MILSDTKVPPITAKNPAMFGGTVNSCAVTLVYPKAVIMVGRKSEKEYMLQELMMSPHHVDLLLTA